MYDHDNEKRVEEDESAGQGWWMIHKGEERERG
jgi:hypothetical protein